MKYPELSYEECLLKKKEALENKQKNNPAKIFYWKNLFPYLSEEECINKMNKYNKERNKQCIEYYNKNYPNLSLEEKESLRLEFIKNYTSKIDLRGERNGMHHSNTTELERRQISPRCIEFYQKKYPNLSITDCEKLRLEYFEKNKEKIKFAIKDTNIEFYLNQGMSKDDAKKALKKRQSTFTLEKCIQRYGEDKGKEMYIKRQQKWKSSLQKSFNHSGSPYTQSNISLKMITDLCNKLKIEVPEKELCLINENENKKHNHYFYDFNYKNVIIEFNGDYWHCNPLIWKSSDYNKSLHLTAQEVWEKDLDKKICAEKHGYKVFIVWDKDYKENPDKVINSCIEFINNETN